MKKKSANRLSVVFNDEEFFYEVSAYADLISSTKSEIVYLLAKEGLKRRINNLSQAEKERLNKMKEMMRDLEALKTN